MSFLAGFLGSQAETHGETTREWKRMWQQDQALKLQEEQMHLQDQYNQAMLDYNQDRLALDTQIFEAGQELDLAKFNSDRTHQFFNDTVMPSFNNMSKAQQVGVYEGLMATKGDNEFADPYLVNMYNSINSGLMTEVDAVSVIEQYLNPKLDAQGNPVSISEAMVNMAIRSLKETDSEYYQEYSKNWEEMKEASEDVQETLREEWLAGIHNTNILTESQINANNAAADLDIARAEHQGLETDILRSTKDFIVQEAQAMAELASQNALDAKTKAKYLDDMMVEALNQARADVAASESSTKGQDLANELADLLMDPTVRSALAAAGISEADAIVAMSTVNARIRAADLTVDELKANIRNLNSTTDLNEEQRDMAKLDVMLELAANGRTDLIEAMGETYLEGFDEDTRAGLLESLLTTSTSEGDYITRMKSLEIGVALAKIGSDNARAALDIAQALNIPEELAAQVAHWEELVRQGDESLAETVRANMAREGHDVEVLSQQKKEHEDRMALGWGQLESQSALGWASHNETVRSNQANEYIAMAGIQAQLSIARGKAVTGPMNTVDATDFAADIFSAGSLWATNRVAELGNYDAAQNALDVLRTGSFTQGDLNVLESHLKELGLTLPDSMSIGITPEALNNAIGVIEKSLKDSRAILEGTFASEVAVFTDRYGSVTGRPGTEGLMFLGVDLDSIGNVLEAAKGLTYEGLDSAAVSAGAVHPAIPMLISDLAVNTSLNTIFDDAIMEDAYSMLVNFLSDDPEEAQALLARAGILGGSDMKDVLQLDFMEAQGMSDLVYRTLDNLGVVRDIDLSSEEDLNWAYQTISEELDWVLRARRIPGSAPNITVFNPGGRDEENRKAWDIVQELGMTVDEASDLGLISDNGGWFSINRDNYYGYLQFYEESLLFGRDSATTLITRYHRGFARGE